MTYMDVDQVLAAYKGSARDKLVLTVLAKHANGDGTCYPSVGTIAEMACIDTRTVQRALSELVTAGVVKRRSRKGRTPLYRLNLAAIPLSDCHPCQTVTPDTVTPTPVESVTPPPSDCQGTPGTVSPESVTEQVIEPATQPGGGETKSGKEQKPQDPPGSEELLESGVFFEPGSPEDFDPFNPPGAPDRSPEEVAAEEAAFDQSVAITAVRQASGEMLTSDEAFGLIEEFGKDRVLRAVKEIMSRPPAGGIRSMHGLVRYKLKHGGGRERKTAKREKTPAGPPCPRCSGNGWCFDEETNTSSKCPECGGTGHVAA